MLLPSSPSTLTQLLEADETDPDYKVENETPRNKRVCGGLPSLCLAFFRVYLVLPLIP